MIYDIGSDLVYIPRIARALERQGDRFLNRCFADAEIAYASAAGSADMMAARLAKRWAAKEAFGKALGSGIAETVALKDICVVHLAGQRPTLRLSGGAKTRLNDIAAGQGEPVIHLSLSDDGEYAQAFVVLGIEKD